MIKHFQQLKNVNDITSYRTPPVEVQDDHPILHTEEAVTVVTTRKIQVDDITTGTVQVTKVATVTAPTTVAEVTTVETTTNTIMENTADSTHKGNISKQQQQTLIHLT